MTTTNFFTRAVGSAYGRGTRGQARGVDVIDIARYRITPAAINTIGVCAGQAAAAAGNLTINGSLAVGGVATLDVQRAVFITAPGTETAVNFTIYGTDMYGEALTWQTAGPAAGEATTSAKTFKTITRVAVDTATTSSVTVGTADVFGLPYKLATFDDLVTINYNGSLVTANTGLTVADTTTPSATTGDVRGKYAVQTATNGSRVLSIYQCVIDPDSTTGIMGAINT